ncbi:MAG: glycosyltransferase family 4 protein [Hahellaceae bacterium]|nr:glycosyltransferase family 4 protein [Hahellaceae bacterium]
MDKHHLTSNTIKVTFLTTSYPLSEGSTSGIFVKRLVDAIPQPYQVSVITPAPSETWNQAYASEVTPFRYAPQRWQLLAHLPGGIPVALKKKRNLLLLPPFLIALGLACFRATRTTRIFHANWSVTGAISGIIGKLSGVPVITTLRGEDISRAEKGGVFLWLLKTCIRTNQQIVCVSQEMGDELRGRFSACASKISFIPNGISDQYLEIPVRTSTARPKDLKLLAVGSLIPRKDFVTVIRALHLLSEEIRPHLNIVGDGPERENLEALIHELALTKWVTLQGRVRPADMAKYYRGADLFILSSLSEGRPNVLIEAMASALPVIATDISGVRELIQMNKNGLLFLPEDAERLAQCLEQLVTSPNLRHDLGHAARKTIINLASQWSETGKQYAKLYDSLLEENRP